MTWAYGPLLPSPLLMAPPLTLTQAAFRGRNDDGSESGATWKAAQNTNWTQDTGVNFRVRFEIQNAAAIGQPTGFQLQYNKNSAGWNNVTGASAVCRAVLSSQIADGVATTNILSAGTGTFAAGSIDEVDGEVAPVTIAASGHTEVEYSIYIVPADVAASDTIQLRVIRDTTTGSTVLNTYSQTPTVTVAKPTRTTTTARLSLTSLTTPDTGTQTLRVRARYTGADDAGTLTVQLYEGGTQRSSQAHTLTGSFNTFSQTVTGVSNYSNLEVRLFATGTAGYTLTPEVSWVQFEVPAASLATSNDTRDVRVTGKAVSDTTRDVRATGLSQTIPLSNTFEGGSNTTAITRANSGGGSGTQWSVIGPGGGGTYTNTQAASGTYSALMTPSTRLEWNGLEGNTRTKVSLKFRHTHADQLAEDLEEFFNAFTDGAGNGGESLVALVAPYDSGLLTNKWVLHYASGSGGSTFGTVEVPANAWHRLDVTYDSVAVTAKYELFLNPNGTTPDEVVNHSTGTSLNANIEKVWFGPHTGVLSDNLYLDDIYVTAPTSFAERDARVRGQAVSSDTRDVRARGKADDATTRDARVTGTIASSDTRDVRVRGQAVSDTTRDVRLRASGNEIRYLVVEADSGTYTLTFRGQTTVPIQFDESGTVIHDALVLLSNINPGDVLVGGDSLDGTIEFQGQYANENIADADFTLDGSGLTNPGTVSLTTQQQGSPLSTTARDVRVRGQATSVDSRDARVTGQAASSDTRDVRVRGQATSSDTRDVRVRGQAASSDTRDVRVTGQAASNLAVDVRLTGATGALDSHTTRDARVRGQADSSHAQDARVRGQADSAHAQDVRTRGQAVSTHAQDVRVRGQLDSSDTRDARVRGQAASADTRDVRVSGNIPSSDTRDVRITGIEAGSSTSVDVRVRGQADSNTAYDVRVRGQLDSSDSRDARARGQADSNATRDVRVTGKLDSSTTQDVRARGAASSSVATDVRTRGQADSNTTRDVRVTGKLDSTHSVDVRVTGKLDSNVSRDVRVRGQLDSSVSQDARVTGKADSSLALDARVRGQASTVKDQDVRVTGAADSSTTRDVRLSANIPTSTSVDVRLRGTRQIIKATEDITVGDWAPEPLYEQVDEIVPDDNDYVSTTTSSTMEIRFGVPDDPEAGTSTVRYRLGKSGSGGTLSYIVTLLDGATVIDQWTHTDVPDGWVTYEQEVTISSYGNLRLRVEAVIT